MNDYTLIEDEDNQGNMWSLCNELTGEFVYVGYEFVPIDSDVRYKIVGGDPPYIQCKNGSMFAKRVGLDSLSGEIRLNPEYFNFRWKRL